MITLHRIGHAHAPLVLNCDLVTTIEANPDTVISLVTGARLLVSETPEQVVAAILDWRAQIGRQTFGVPTVAAPADSHDFPRPAAPPSGLHSV